MTKTNDPDAYLADAFLIAREQFALRKSNAAAAKLLRAALHASSVDLIDDEEQEGVLFDVIEYLEQTK